jgi:hypothetical protein
MEKSQSAIVLRRTVTLFIRKKGEVVILGGGEGECRVMWVKSEKSVRSGGNLDQAVRGGDVRLVELKRADGDKMELE